MLNCTEINKFSFTNRMYNMKLNDQYSSLELPGQAHKGHGYKKKQALDFVPEYVMNMEYRIFPVPESIVYHAGGFRLDQPLLLYANFKPEFMPETLRNIKVKNVSLQNVDDAAVKIMFFTANKYFEPGFQALQTYDEEEYLLRIDQDGILLAAGDYRGIVNAMATLDCIMRQSDNRYLRSCEVKDKPDLKLRGAMLCLHQMHDFMPYFGPSFDTVSSLFLDAAFEAKLNCLLIEYEAFYPWSGEHSRISCKEAFTPEQIRQLNLSAAQRGIEIIPLVQTLGHVYHILIHEEYRDCAEDPEYPQQLCPLSEKSYKLATELIDDTIKLHPDSRYIHLGGDECRRLGVCPDCAEFSLKFGKYQLYADYYKKITDYVLSKGCIPILWHDIAAKQPEVMKNFDQRVVFQFWNYGDVSHGVAEPQLNRLCEFYPASQIIGGSAARAARNHGCLHPSYAIISANINEINRHMFECRTLGSIMTDWPDSGMTYFAAMMPCLLQGETAWNAGRSDNLVFRRDYARFRFGIDAPELLDKLDALYGLMPFSHAFQSQLKSHLNRYEFRPYAFTDVVDRIRRVMSDEYAETELYKIFSRRLLCIQLQEYLADKIEKCRYNRYELEYYQLINKVTIMFASMAIGMMQMECLRGSGCIPDRHMIDCSGIEKYLKDGLSSWDSLRNEFFEFYARYSVVDYLNNYLDMLFKPEIKHGVEAFLREAVSSDKNEN